MPKGRSVNNVLYAHAGELSRFSPIPCRFTCVYISVVRYIPSGEQSARTSCQSVGRERNYGADHNDGRYAIPGVLDVLSKIIDLRSFCGYYMALIFNG